MSITDTTPPGHPPSLPPTGNRVQITDEKEGLAETAGPALNKIPDENAEPHADKREKRPAPRGECKFDGTDYPDWLPINPFKKANEPFTFPFPEIDGDPWAKAAKKVKDYDDAMCTAWTEEIQNILLFAGLFSAVVTAFAVETKSMLQPDPAVASVLLLAHLSTQLGNGSGLEFANTIAAPFQKGGSSSQLIRINVFMYFSLVLSLGTALVGIIALQWIRSYRQSDSQSDKDHLALRQSRYESLVNWKVPQIIATLPLILQASLIIFFAGLIDFLDSLNVIVTIIISLLIGAITLFVSFTAVAPIYPFICMFARKPLPSHCPYQSPQSWLFLQLFFPLKSASDFVYYNWMALLFSDPLGQYCRKLSREVALGRKLMAASNWVQMVQVNVNSPWNPNPESTPIAHSLQWISGTFTDLDSFCTLFHCFQTLDNNEMLGTLLAIYNKSNDSDPDSVMSKIAPLYHDVIQPLEKKHLFSNALLYWGLDHRYWEHPGIMCHALELSLRSATYSIGPDPRSKYPDKRIVMSKLPFWPKLQQSAADYCDLTGKRLRPISDMWSFGFLVYFQESESDSRSTPGFIHYPSYRNSIESLQRLMFWHHLVDFWIFDEIIGVFDKWLITFLSRNVDDEAEDAQEGCNMVKQIIDFAYWAVDAIRYDPEGLSSILQRPIFLSFLDHFAEHPQRLKPWQDHLRNCHYFGSDKFGWYRLFVDNFVETRYAALVLDSDKQQFELLVDERDRQRLPQGVEAGVWCAFSTFNS